MSKRKANGGSELAPKMQRTIDAPCAFERVPLDIRRHILSYATEPKDVLSARIVCRDWNGIVMDPPPVVAYVDHCSDFMDMVKAVSIAFPKRMPFTLTEGALMASGQARHSYCVEAKIPVNTGAPVGGNIYFLLPTDRLLSLLECATRDHYGGRIRIVLFERIERVTVMFTKIATMRFSAPLVREAKERYWGEIADPEFVFVAPLARKALASMRYHGTLFAEARVGPSPDYLRGRYPGDSLMALTLQTSHDDPEIDYYYTGDNSANAYWLQIPSRGVKRGETTNFETVFALHTNLCVLQDILSSLEVEVKGVELCVTANEDPYVLRHRGVFEAKWLILRGSPPGW